MGIQKQSNVVMSGRFYWGLIGLLSLLVTSAGVVLFFLISPDKRIENLPQIVGSIGSLLTVVWFTASLFYQNRQIMEQSRQFVLSYNQQRVDSKRGAVEFARECLVETEKLFLERAGRRLSEASLMISEYGTIFKVVNELTAEAYFETIPLIGKTEGAFQAMVVGFETAARAYFEAAGVPTITFDHPEEFVVTMKPEMRKIPYFSQFDSSVYLVADIMERLRPGRDAICLGIQIAIALKNPELMKHDKIKEAIGEHRAKYGTVPAIVGVYERNHGSK